MEDRKRSAGDDLAPSTTKRQNVNAKSSADPDLQFSGDLESFTKDAVLRRMWEYKREKTTLESQLKEVQQRATDHDDHLRVVDAWWTQLLEEVKLLAEDELPSVDDLDDAFPTTLNFKGSEEFQRHLSSKGKNIKSKLQTIFTNLSSSRGPPSENLQDLQGRFTKLLGAQKEIIVKMQRLEAEKHELSERLELASLRYVKAEKRLDRAKSKPVAKMEQQLIGGTGNSSSSGIGNVENVDVEMTNGIAEEVSSTAFKETAAVIEKQKEQLEAVTAESKTLTEQLTAANLKLSNLTEDDYARTDLFKQFRLQHEDTIRRINHLEATNIQLREEAEQFQAERTAHRTMVENEQEIITSEIESQLQRVEADLTRVRSARDELIAEQAMYRASREHEKTSGEHVKELVAAKEDRISALEQEIRRLKAASSSTCEPMHGHDIESLDLDELRIRYQSLVVQYEAINNELPAIQSAYTKMQGLAHKKVMDLATLEDKIQVLSAEKSKADQKYFAARKDMDTRLGEVRALRAQNAKSSEIISQLKDVETSNRNLLSNLEKQLTDVRQSNTITVVENKKLEVSLREATSKATALKNQVTELSNQLKAKDLHNANTKQRIQEVTLEIAGLRVKYEQAQKESETWKKKSLGNQSSEEEMLRTLALCTICRKDFKNTALRTCGHTFCNNCVADRLANRMRKCPNCSSAFDKSDVMHITL